MKIIKLGGEEADAKIVVDELRGEFEKSGLSVREIIERSQKDRPLPDELLHLYMQRFERCLAGDSRCLLDGIVTVGLAFGLLGEVAERWYALARLLPPDISQGLRQYPGSWNAVRKAIEHARAKGAVR